MEVTLYHGSHTIPPSHLTSTEVRALLDRPKCPHYLSDITYLIMSLSHFPPVTLALLLFKYGSMLFSQGYPIDAPSPVHSPSSSVSFFIFYFYFFGFETFICHKFSSLPHSSIALCHFLSFVLSDYLFKIESSNHESNSFP